MALFKKKEPANQKNASSESLIEDKIAKTIQEIEILYDTEYDETKIQQLNQLSFTFCMGAVSAARKMPGIDRHMGFQELYQCPDEASKEIVRFNMQKMFGISDFNSLLQVGNRMFSSGKEYDQFYTFWNNEPAFNIEELTPEAKDIFLQCKAFARYFYPYLKETGMYAWDYNERIGLLRNAYACDIINRQQFDDLTIEMVNRTLNKYHNWKEYAISCICGGAYFMFKNSLKIEDALRFLELNKTIAAHLIKEDRVWTDASWGFVKATN